VLFDPGFSKLPEKVQRAKDKKLHDRLHELGPARLRRMPKEIAYFDSQTSAAASLGVDIDFRGVGVACLG